MVSGRGESNVLDVIFHRSESKLAQSGDSAEQTTSSGGECRSSHNFTKI